VTHDHRKADLFDANRHRRELDALVRQIQALTLELQNLRQREPEPAELASKERTLEQLRWRLATVARSFAADDPGAAA
jgi:hypothetical protein